MDKVASLRELISPDQDSEWVTNLWTKYDNQKVGTKKKWSEINKYITATDTKSTTNSKLPWTHTSTIPKLTQIRDNLHSNYISSLFPNDKWLTWLAFSREAAKKEKANIITAYMDNKTRQNGFRQEISKLLLDYIDKGNCFAMSHYQTTKRIKEDGLPVTNYTGPKSTRIDPLDIVFDPTVDFDESWKIVRSILKESDIQKLIQDDPSKKYWEKALERRHNIRAVAHSISPSDWEKAEMYQVDGFGSLYEYYGTTSFEVLEFFGDYYDEDTNTVYPNRVVTIVDRSIMVRNEEVETYDGKPLIRKSGWRPRPNNSWSMGPLENLVGLQYMLDHYHNMGANALDLKIMPPKKVVGPVEGFTWAPNELVIMDEGGDVIEMAQDFGDIYTLRDWLQDIEYRMELYAGAPREAMGIRTPGEKTAFEVQSLENAAGRIFQEKITQFELFMEQVLNDMLQTSHRNMDQSEVIRIVNSDVGVALFEDIGPSDITADGILRPIGARHFAQRAQDLQNLASVAQTPMWMHVQPHISGVALADYLEDMLDLRGYDVFQKNIAIQEAQEQEMIAGQAQQDIEGQLAIDDQGIEQEVFDATSEDQSGPTQGPVG